MLYYAVSNYSLYLQQRFSNYVSRNKIFKSQIKFKSTASTKLLHGKDSFLEIFCLENVRFRKICAVLN